MTLLEAAQKSRQLAQMQDRRVLKWEDTPGERIQGATVNGKVLPGSGPRRERKTHGTP